MNIKTVLMALALTLTASMAAQALGGGERQSSELRFECKEKYGGTKIILTARVTEYGVGRIETPTIETAVASYETSGLSHVWEWGEGDDQYLYRFIIKPDMTGLYYDFTYKTEKVPPTLIVVCTLKKQKRKKK